MNRGIKYILGFALIFLAAVVCVFGIIKYEESKENSTSSNQSENLGSVNNQNSAKETTIVIEKLASTADVDTLKNELNLSDDVANILKNYAPKVSYAIKDNKVYVRQGGYLKNNKVQGINQLLGSYEIKDGKLSNISETPGDLSNLTWMDLNIKNSEHNLAAAKEIVDKYFFPISGKQELSGVSVFGYLSNPENRKDTGTYSLTIMPLSQVVDIYNTALKDTYSEKDVRVSVAAFDDMKYKEIEDSYAGNESKYNSTANMGELLYFTKDKVYLTAIGGIGGASMVQPSSQSSWTIEGDKIMVPLIGPNNSQMGRMVLRLNNKEYEGGQARSKYYVESVTK